MKDDTYERRPGKDSWSMCSYCTRDGSCVGNNIQDRQLKCEYLLYVYTRANSCVDMLIAEGRRDSHLPFLKDTSSKDYA